MSRPTSDEVRLFARRGFEPHHELLYSRTQEVDLEKIDGTSYIQKPLDKAAAVDAAAGRAASKSRIRVNSTRYILRSMLYQRPKVDDVTV